MSVFDEKYIKAKIREFNGVIKTNFLGNEKPKQNVRYACRACITINSVMITKIKKNYPQVYLEQCKYKTKKINMSEFINTELELQSELESDTELEPKSELESYSE